MGADADPHRLAGRHGHWMLARRSICDATEITYYVSYGPRKSTLLDLAWFADTRWRIEECFQQAKTKSGPITAKSIAGEPGTDLAPCPCSPTPSSPYYDPLP